MNIAILTKPNMESNPTRLKVLELLRSFSDYCVKEISLKEEISADTDRVLVFGGDGTMLEAVRAIRGRDIPVLGVNLGHLGFLASFEQNADCNRIIDCLKNGERVSRMLLDIEINAGDIMRSLNEVVIKSAGTRPITLDISIDGEFADSFHSDGIIVSSPAGSTAYSLSAGGPVLAPDVDAIVIIPICAHSLHSRPLVVNASSKIEIKLSGEHRGIISVDGANNGTLEKNEIIRVTKSLKSAVFLSDGDENFYAKLLKKMNRWGTTSK